MTKKQVRAKFRQSVFDRDGHKCKICGRVDNLDAHHIINRNHMPNGGYVPTNGITLCDICHPLAEEAWDYYQKSQIMENLVRYYPYSLFGLIGSSQEMAEKDSK